METKQTEKANRQKVRVLTLMQILTESTDEEHPMKTEELIRALEHSGIHAERKTLYSDIEALREFGLDIVCRRSAPAGYYIASRTFELVELKLLVDAVQASRFITRRKADQLISRIEGLASRHEAKLLQREVYVGNRVRTMNESVYYSIDQIHQAISTDRRIRFQYCEWTIKKQLKVKKNGEYYLVSPWKMVWNQDNYYLIGIDETNGEVRHYRVDKMLHIEISGEGRSGTELFQDFDVARYTNATFGMYAGHHEVIAVEASESLVGVLIDRFGQELLLQRFGENLVRTWLHVNVSPQFFGWLASLGNGIRILNPERVREEYCLFLEENLKFARS